MPPKQNADIRSFFTSSQSQPAASSSQRTQSASLTPAPPTPLHAPTAPIQAPLPAPVQSTPPSPPAQAPRSPSAEEQQRTTLTPAPATSALRSPSPLGSVAASITSSPPASPAPRQAYERDAVIAASDDENGGGFASSDSELPDLMAPPAGKKRVVEDKQVMGGTTPRAARRVTAAAAANAHQVLFDSPLSIRKKHKYDLKALGVLHGKDLEARAGEARVRELELEGLRKRGGSSGEKRARDSGGDEEDEDEGEGGDEARSGEISERKVARDLKRELMNSLSKDGDEEGGRAKKARALRAIERAAESATTGKKTFYFFEQNESGSDTETSIWGHAFPIKQAKGPWKILSDKQDRARHFQSGFLYDIQTMFGDLPDEIFLWVLNEVCHEKRRDLAVEYAKLLCSCHDDQVRRLVTPELLHELFRVLGATKHIESLKAAVVLTDELNDPYPRRSWTCLENFLGLLGSIAKCLDSATRTTAMQMLLRLGMDKVAVENFGLAQEWRWAVDLVARSVPSSEWTGFCQEVCNSLYQSTDKATLRYKAINLLGPVQRPESPPDLQRRTLDLKRRLACVFFFDDLSRADKEPEDTVNMRAIIDCLDQGPYLFSSKNPTVDFRELAASMLLLNIALGDAAKQQTVVAPGSGREFDREVDELADNLKSMANRVNVVNDGIHVSRIEAKSALELIRARLLYQLRTTRKVSQMGIQADEPEDPLPRQQSFMEKFMKKKMDKARPSIETEGIAA